MIDWKHTNEILPTHNQNVLMGWEDGTVLQGKYFVSTTLQGFAVKTGKHYSGKMGVAYWMPLPKVPGHD